MKTIHHQPTGQHEPLLTPPRWQGEERRFAIRLQQLLEELFQTQRALIRRVSALEEEHNAQI